MKIIRYTLNGAPATVSYSEKNLEIVLREADDGTYSIGYEPDILTPMTAEEVLSVLLPQQINAVAVDDNTALRMKRFYPSFDAVIGQKVTQGFKFTHGDKLWSVVQPELTIEKHYPPGEGMESLYTEVCETHTGAEDDPIPYNGNMALTMGLYYHQDGVLYLCTRDTISPVYNALSELAGLYVERIT